MHMKGVDIHECGGYALISTQDSNPAALVEVADSMMARGWKPLGGIAVARSQSWPLWAQAFTRSDEV